MPLRRNSSLMVGLAAVSLMGFGCNPFQSVQDQIGQKIGEKVVETAVEKATGGKVALENSKEQVVFRDSKTGDMMAFGENVKLPEDFPKDVPIYAGVKVVGVTISKQVDKGTSVTLKSGDTVDQVVAWYTAQLKSAEFTENSSASAGGTEIRSYVKGNVKLALTVSSQGDSTPGSVIALIRTESK